MEARTNGLKCIIVGDGNVGKTSLAERFVLNEFSEQRRRTIGATFIGKTIEFENHSYTLEIWDTSGQERHGTLRQPFYLGTEICFLVFALDEVRSFRNLVTWRDELIRSIKLDQPELFAFVVVGNKCDLESRAVSSQDAAAWCAANGGMQYLETSAKTGVNVEDAFKTGLGRWLEVERALGHIP